MDYDNILLVLASHGSSIETSTIKLSSELKLSQQSVSRKFIEMERAGLIKRQASPRGITLKITSEGNRLLRKKYLKLKAVLENDFRVSGTVFSSMGEGSYYLKQNGYTDQIKSELGFFPYPGTLNIKTEDFPVTESIKISGFKNKERSFGALECYPAKIGSTKGAIVVPQRTHHEGVLEIIAPVYLRDKLRIKDGDTITLEVIP